MTRSTPLSISLCNQHQIENDDCSELTFVDNPPPESKKKEARQVIDLKMKLAQQQERLDALTSKLNQYQAENEALTTEKMTLVDELVTHTRQEQPIKRRRWFSAREKGSLQMLLDANAKLMMDNERLQTMNCVLRKSFETHIDDTRRSSILEKETIERLQRELHQQLSVPEKISLGEDTEGTAQTSLDSSGATENEGKLLVDFGESQST